MTANLKTITQTAELFGVTRATIRNRVKRFGEFLSITATRKNGKRFNHDDIRVLHLIHDMKNTGMREPEILLELPEAIERDKRLADVEILDNDIPQDTPQEPQEQPQSIQTVDLMQDVMRLLEQQENTFQQVISSKDEMIQELKADKEKLQNQLDDARRPWWRKLFGG